MGPVSGPVTLVINSGSSTLKFGLYRGPELLLSGAADHIGSMDKGTLKATDADEKLQLDEKHGAATQGEALKHVAQALARLSFPRPQAVGHRVVHGGPKLVAHQRITPEVLQTLEDSVHFAPLHIPSSLELIRSAQTLYPEAQQFACFDTAFHQTLLEPACHYPLPFEYWEAGVRRYGFHGLSYESVVRQVGDALPVHCVVAHLGSGSSVAALDHGQSIDTSMGMTPTGGIPMGTRPGDLDPGVLLYLLRNHASQTASLTEALEWLEQMLNHDCGLIALSGGTSDMRDLQTSAEKNDEQAALAIDIYARSIAKTIAAYASVLQGVDLIVFTGGIGEHSPHLREMVCQRLSFLGIEIETDQNTKSVVHPARISGGESRIAVAIVPADENGQIARHCAAMFLKETAKN